MKISKFLETYIFFLFFSFLSFDSIGQEKVDGPISIQGNEYPNSCSLEERLRLKNNLYKENIPNKDEAWNIVELLLCAPSTKTNVDKILKSTKSKIKIEAEATGERESDSSIVTANSKLIQRLLAQGQAWRASIFVLHNSIRLQYFPNEACVEERVLEFSTRRWKLGESGQACD